MSYFESDIVFQIMSYRDQTFDKDFFIFNLVATLDHCPSLRQSNSYIHTPSQTKWTESHWILQLIGR